MAKRPGSTATDLQNLSSKKPKWSVTGLSRSRPSSFIHTKKSLKPVDDLSSLLSIHTSSSSSSDDKNERDCDNCDIIADYDDKNDDDNNDNNNNNSSSSSIVAGQWEIVSSIAFDSSPSKSTDSTVQSQCTSALNSIKQATTFLQSKIEELETSQNEESEEVTKAWKIYSRRRSSGFHPKPPIYLFKPDWHDDFTERMDLWYATTGFKKEWSCPIPIKFEHFMYWMYVTKADYEIKVSSVKYAGTYGDNANFIGISNDKTEGPECVSEYPMTVTRRSDMIMFWINVPIKKNSTGGKEQKHPLCYTLPFPSYKEEGEKQLREMRLDMKWQTFEKMFDYPREIKLKDMEGDEWSLMEDRNNPGALPNQLRKEIDNLFLR